MDIWKCFISKFDNMKKTNLIFIALFITANVFVGCDSSLYDDVSVSNQSKQAGS